MSLFGKYSSVQLKTDHFQLPAQYRWPIGSQIYRVIIKKEKLPTNLSKHKSYDHNYVDFEAIQHNLAPVKHQMWPVGGYNWTFSISQSLQNRKKL